MCVGECVSWVANSQGPDRSPQTQKGLQTLKAFSPQSLHPCASLTLRVCLFTEAKPKSAHERCVSVLFLALLWQETDAGCAVCFLQVLTQDLISNMLQNSKQKSGISVGGWGWGDDNRAYVMSLLIFNSSDCSLLFQTPPTVHDWKQWSAASFFVFLCSYFFIYFICLRLNFLLNLTALGLFRESSCCCASCVFSQASTPVLQPCGSLVSFVTRTQRLSREGGGGGEFLSDQKEKEKREE